MGNVVAGPCYSRDRNTSNGNANGETYVYNSSTDDLRFMKFWMKVGPIVVKYKWNMMLSRGDAKDEEERLERLHQETAPKAREIAETFGGIFVKAGQAISSRPELAPAPFITELRKLQSEAPPCHWGSVRQALEEELGPVNMVFDSIEQGPLGSASIGQAHRAIWQGHSVVVKVQYPGIAWKVRSDLSNIRLLAKIADPEALPVLNKICEQFEQELDYDQEHKALLALHKGIVASPEFSSRVAVPAPIAELSRGKVIGMEFLPGPKLEEALRERLAALGIDVGATSLKEMMMDQLRNASSDTNGANGATGITSQNSSGSTGAARKRPQCMATCGRGLLRLCGPDRSLRMARKALDAWLWLRCRSFGLPPPKDLGEILRLVVRVHGYQIFFCELFNADPHPGNILLLPDGRIGLIDFGFCTRLDIEEKRLLARLFVILAESPPHGVSAEADQQVMEATSACGVQTENNSMEVMSLFARLAFCKIEPKWLQKDYVKNIMMKDKVKEFPLCVLMAGRCAALLRGLCFGLQENVSCAGEWAPYARRWLQEYG